MPQSSITSFFKPSSFTNGSAFTSRRLRDPGSPAAIAQPRRQASPPQDDPFDFSNLHIREQKRDYRMALREIQGGWKRSHWIWWIIPTPPNVEDGVEKASMTNSMYALRDRPGALEGDLAATAYLQFPEKDGVHLRSNYLRIMRAALEHLRNGVHSVDLMGGSIDASKLRKSAELFERASRPACAADKEVNEVCRQILAELDQEDAAAEEEDEEEEDASMRWSAIGGITSKSSSAASSAPAQREYVDCDSLPDDHKSNDGDVEELASEG